ncbi:MAG: HAD hydrolase family protein [Prevotellaceae bacterium]|jgi:3-deoxy-D-manno-octulosonate 8-phosphate phosphatase (KDO 8-P phosphatase)|nr:HAD hydrolase family protein [Prevotellaceae bacterium]
MNHYKKKLPAIKAFAFDVDGVLTDGSVQVSDRGDLLRTYNAKDGLAIRMAIDAGYPIAIISGGASETICRRFTMLGIREEDIYLRSRIKTPDLLDFCRKYDLQPAEVAFIGDDLPDVAPMRCAGLSCCPSDAVPEVLAVAEYISPCRGGAGCVRDIIEQVLKIQQRW